MIVPGFQPGDRVRVAEGRDGPVSGQTAPVGREFVIPADENAFDNDDDSWRLENYWVYESCLELVSPALTEEEVAAAIASVKET